MGSIDDSFSPAPEADADEGEEEKRAEAVPTQAEIDTLRALPAVGTVNKQSYPYDEEKGDFKSSDPTEDDNYWPFDRGVIQDGTLEFSPPRRQPFSVKKSECQ